MKRNIAVGAVLVLAFFVSVIMIPTKLIASNAPQIDLETMIPKAFGDWKMDEAQAGFVISPDVQEQLDLIYNQTLSRTYVNSSGQRIMLAIAYGGDQSRDLQVHKPEKCYKAQGFSVRESHNSRLDFDGASIKIRNLVAINGRRIEPVTYWIRVSGTTVYSGVEQTLKRIQLGLMGYISDGVLVRVSNIAVDDRRSSVLHNDFIQNLLSSVDSETLTMLIGEKEQL